MLINSESHWMPVGMHGTLIYNDGDDISDVVRKAIKQLVPRAPAFVDIKYIIDTNEDGSKTLTFEVS